MLCSHLKTFKLMAWPRFATSLVAAQLILPRWRIISFWCCADFQQRSNKRMVVFPEHGPAQFAVLKILLIWIVWKFSKTFEFFKNIWTKTLWLGRAPPNTAQFISRCWRTFCVWKLCSHLQTFKFEVGPRSPTYFVTAQLTSQRWRIVFVLKLCRLSTTFKWREGRAFLNTVQIISRGLKSFAFGWYEAFQYNSNSCLGCAPLNTAQFLSRCWRTFLFGCYAVM